MTIHRLRKCVESDYDALNAMIFDKIKDGAHLVTDIVSHIIQGGGKQLRPLVVLLSSHACGYKGTQHIELAAMVEFLHTATLLHDDVIDESKMRRGRETANTIWGDKVSILVGDYLFTQYVQIMISFENVKINQLMTDTAFQISFGELQQHDNRHKHSLTETEYFGVICAKTSKLFAASSCVAAILSNADDRVQKAMYEYGLHLGTAFQLIDDALDYCGDATVFGKNIGDDLAFGTPTLPLIHALRNGSTIQQEQIRHALEHGSLENLTEILIAIKETKAIEYTKKMAVTEVDTAISALNAIPDSEYKTALIELAHYAVSRDH